MTYENEEELKKVLAKTEMLFITAGMGGGTGTGAAPVIATIAKEMGILTVSICTLSFAWEGNLRRKQAEDGLAELKKYSDSVLVILNDKLREIYHNLKVSEAFAHADNVLSSAAKCIAELINVALRINVDFNDVRRVMETSGVAIMGSAMASGEGRSLKAVTQALNSPLLNDNDIRGARYVLVSITCGTGKDELSMEPQRWPPRKNARQELGCTLTANPGRLLVRAAFSAGRRGARLWADVLEIDKVGIHDDFFELGGASNQVLQFISKARVSKGCIQE